MLVSLCFWLWVASNNRRYATTKIEKILFPLPITYKKVNKCLYL